MAATTLAGCGGTPAPATARVPTADPVAAANAEEVRRTTAEHEQSLTNLYRQEVRMFAATEWGSPTLADATDQQVDELAALICTDTAPQGYRTVPITVGATWGLEPPAIDALFAMTKQEKCG